MNHTFRSSLRGEARTTGGDRATEKRQASAILDRSPHGVAMNGLRQLMHDGPAAAAHRHRLQAWLGPSGRPAVAQGVPLPPRRFAMTPPYEIAIRFDWSRGQQGTIGNVQVLPRRPLAGGSPMEAWVGQNPPTVYYDHVLCGQMGGRAAYFILLHELGHIDAPEQRLPYHMIDKERQADDTATLNLIADYPNIAEEVLEAIAGYMQLTNSPQTTTHPSDASRRDRVLHVKSLLNELEGTIKVHNDNRISEAQARGALKALGFDSEADIPRLLRDANEKGAMILSSPSGGLMNYSELGRMLRNLDAYEQAHGIAFTLNVNWLVGSPQSLFRSLDAPDQSHDIADLTALMARMAI